MSRLINDLFLFPLCRSVGGSPEPVADRLVGLTMTGVEGHEAPTMTGEEGPRTWAQFKLVEGDHGAQDYRALRLPYSLRAFPLSRDSALTFNY